MEDIADLHDWELILGSDISDNLKAIEFLDEDTEDGAIKADYFALDSGGRQHPQSESDEISNASDNPSWVDPDSDSRLLETSRGKLGFDGMNFPMRNSGAFWSDDSSDGHMSLPDSQKTELGDTGDSLVGLTSEEIDARCENLGEESEGSGDSRLPEIVVVSGVGAGSGCEGEKREGVWWKMPLELLKFCIFRARPVWSISIAAAMLGIVMLGRKLYRMKHKSRSIPLRIAIDDKKPSHLMVHAARLNEAISVVRHMPFIRPSLPAGATQWAALPLR